MIPDGRMSQRVAEALEDESVTDVFRLSHGWRGDVPAARTQYSRWIGAMAACTSDINRIKSETPGLPSTSSIGLHWPSEPWGDDTLPSVESFGTDGIDPVEDLANEAAGKIVDTLAARKRPLRTIFNAAARRQ